MNAVDPLARKIGEHAEVLFGRQPSRLETSHLARRRGASGGRFAADDPAHRRIMPKPSRVVHILVSSQSPEHGLPQHPHERVPAVLAGAGVGEPLARHGAEAECVVEFAVCEQTSIGGHDRNGEIAASAGGRNRA